MSSTTRPNQLRGLPLLIGPSARVLILGSFPSAASLAAQQYYAHPQNQFWKILGAIIAQPLHDMPYPARCHAVCDAGIAIWDVYASCERVGSLDSAIRNGIANDFSVLKNLAPAGRPAGPGIRRILFNGQTPGRFAPQLVALGYETQVMPSTSPANAGWRIERKLAAWRAGLAL